MEPVLDTSDLTAIAALADPEPQPEPELSLAFTDPDEHRRRRDARANARWVTQAKTLAAAGVTPAPSHREHRTADGNTRLWPSTWGAFADSGDILADLVAAGATLPGSHLVLFGVEVDPHHLTLPHLPAGYPWIAVAHQSAGIACHHRHLVGIRLEVSPDADRVVHALATFADHDGHRCIGCGPVHLSDLRRYAELCDRLGVSAETAWDALEEGCYPLDETAAQVLSDTPVPTWEERHPSPGPDATPLERLAALGEATGERTWRVWVLGPNCD